jgi:hypothetical protein
VFIVVIIIVYFVIDSDWKLMDIPSYFEVLQQYSFSKY